MQANAKNTVFLSFLCVCVHWLGEIHLRSNKNRWFSKQKGVVVTNQTPLTSLRLSLHCKALLLLFIVSFCSLPLDQCAANGGWLELVQPKLICLRRGTSEGWDYKGLRKRDQT